MAQQTNVQVTPADPDKKSTTQIGVTDLAGQLVTDPTAIMNDNMKLSENVPTVSEADKKAGEVDPNQNKYQVDPNATNAQASTVTNPAQATAQQVSEADTAQGTAPEAKDAAPIETATTKAATEQNQMQAAQGQVSDNALANADDVQIDTEATANGENALGQALNQSAQQNISTVIDTSTMAGKILAEQLGEGNYTDSKATIKGQLDILQAEFVDPATGEPRIPSWAAGTARNVSRIATFGGMTGTAATAAMAQALMEASLPVAQQDAQFFQTVTLQNLSNRQEATINRANVLSKLELANLDSRTQIAVQNANAFMQMDLANLNNEQQARLINTQDRQQSILEDAKAENANRLFVAQSQNEKDMFYDNLSAAMEQFNASQMNNMNQFNVSQANDISKFNADQSNTSSMFNASQLNDMAKFNSDLENNREQFYKNMQFQIDTANAKWRQTVTLQENQNQFEAASTDVKNAVGISVEELNRLWDRSDALLDYAWKTADNEADRANQIALAKLQAKLKEDSDNSTGFGNFIGTILGIGGSMLKGSLGL